MSKMRKCTEVKNTSSCTCHKQERHWIQTGATKSKCARHGLPRKNRRRADKGINFYDRYARIDLKEKWNTPLQKSLTFKWSLILLKRLNTTRKVKLKICRSGDWLFWSRCLHKSPCIILVERYDNIERKKGEYEAREYLLASAIKDVKETTRGLTRETTHVNTAVMTASCTPASLPPIAGIRRDALPQLQSPRSPNSAQSPRFLRCCWSFCSLNGCPLLRLTLLLGLAAACASPEGCTRSSKLA